MIERLGRLLAGHREISGDGSSTDEELDARVRAVEARVEGIEYRVNRLERHDRDMGKRVNDLEQGRKWSDEAG